MKLKTKEHFGRHLTKEEKNFCNKNNLTLGYDDDDETKFQFSHIVEDEKERFKALCRSNRLWLAGQEFGDKSDRITCEKCLTIFKKLYKK